MPSEAAESKAPNTAVVPGGRRFEIPVSTDVLRRLQGALCVECGIADRGRLFPAGRACSVGPDGEDPLWWDVRAHANCLGAAS